MSNGKYKHSNQLILTFKKIALFESPQIGKDNQPMFFNLIKKGFSSKRKKLYNNITKAFDIEKTLFQDMLVASNIDIDSRPESLTFDNWRNLYLSMKNIGY